MKKCQNVLNKMQEYYHNMSDIEFVEHFLVFEDMLGNEIKVGDVIAIPESGRGYGQTLGVVTGFEVGSSKGKLLSNPLLKYAKNHYSDDFNDFNDLSDSYKDIKLSTCNQYCIKVTQLIDEKDLILIETYLKEKGLK